jgi:hypothetical protein
MWRLTYLALAALVFATPDVPQRLRWKGASQEPEAFPSGANLAVQPAFAELAASSSKDKGKGAGRLRPESELAIVRYVDGEFARAVRPLPSVKKGIQIKPGAPVDETMLRKELTRNPLAAGPGDTVQITRIEFHSTQISLDINGGSNKHKRLLDRIQVDVGGLPQGRVVSQVPGIQQIGTTLVLDFGGPVPDLSPDQVKEYLAAFLDFSRQRSPAVNWVETLPPDFKKAITDKRAIVGMDHEMVLAALGQPGRKVRERSPEGVDTEDWIYGQPPEKMVFVTFIGDKVVKVEQFN